MPEVLFFVVVFQLRKLQDKLRKCQQEVEVTREKYQACLNDLNGYNAKYIEDMTEVSTTTTKPLDERTLLSKFKTAFSLKLSLLISWQCKHYFFFKTFSSYFM